MNKDSPDISSEVETSLQLVVVPTEANEFLEQNKLRTTKYVFQIKQMNQNEKKNIAEAIEMHLG